VLPHRNALDIRYRASRRWRWACIYHARAADVRAIRILVIHFHNVTYQRDHEKVFRRVGGRNTRISGKKMHIVFVALIVDLFRNLDFENGRWHCHSNLFDAR
jgi:hypothetical protein